MRPKLLLIASSHRDVRRSIEANKAGKTFVLTLSPAGSHGTIEIGRH